MGSPVIHNVTNNTTPVEYPTYMTLYKWEDFEYNSWQSWMSKNWTISVYLAVFYVVLIFLGREWMKNKQPYRLRTALVFWNFGLAAFSIIAFLRVLPELLFLLGEPNGFHTSVCSTDRMNIVTVFWKLMMCFSKVAELGDTLFIILRKQPLILLHWYHHASVMLYGWYTYHQHDATHRWFMAINLFVHSIMYSYYAMKAMGIKLPKSLAMTITSTQLLQMFFGVSVNGYALYMKYSGIDCQTETFNIYLALAMYASYAILFSNFFKKAYISGKEKRSIRKSD